tara:strand:- start:684 stop:1301 length:618 start_codon:yes stop_codon:yes gene_type:complete
MHKIRNHWEQVYKKNNHKGLSWYQKTLKKSLLYIDQYVQDKELSIIDVGCGSSTLVDDLIDKGYKNISANDISISAIKLIKSRLGERSSKVNWINSDILKTNLPHREYFLWHDRAVFHFLVNLNDRLNYIDKITSSVRKKGFFLIASFAHNGPEMCSGLPVIRFTPKSLKEELGDQFSLIKCERETHKTPLNIQQRFLYCLFQKN